MPNIELHGYGSKAHAMRLKVRKAFASYPDVDEIITSVCNTDPRDRKGKLMPYLRVVGSRDDMPNLEIRLAQLKQDIEVIYLSKWIPKDGPTKEDSVVENYLDMRPLEFYTEDRFRGRNFTRGTAATARDIVGIAACNPPSKTGHAGSPLKTVREFRDYFSGKTVLFLRIQYGIEAVRKAIVDVSNHAGIAFEK